MEVLFCTHMSFLIDAQIKMYLRNTAAMITVLFYIELPSSPTFLLPVIQISS